ncbi:MAG: LacI family DNA-binding transcriptional regulator [Rhodobacteraceae bacterium]|nr:LacI family DNA-binding transcriptional regulator [Paracoccaceae bacterium]
MPSDRLPGTVTPRPTMAYLARAAGVSKSTVSRAFSRPEMLDPNTVARIAGMAARLGYVPNRAARGLSTGRHGNIAMIVPDIANPFFPPLIRAAQTEADRSEFCVFLGNSDEDPAHEDRLVSRFLGQVEGLVLVASRLAEDRIRAHADRCPLVLVNRDVAGIPRILIDSAPAVGDAVAHLHDLGHRRIAYVSGPARSWSDGQRRAAVTAAAARLDIALTILPVSKPTYETGRAVARDVVATGASAAIAFDDVTAHGLMTGLADLGLRVPADVSVVGCDDVLGAHTMPPLTTVSTSSRDAGRNAVALLFERLTAGTGYAPRTMLTTRLVVRQTSGPGPRLQR